jgi:protein-disulfide isomerase
MLRFAHALYTGFIVAVLASGPATAQSWYPIQNADGSPAMNFKVPTELTSEIEKLAGKVAIGPETAEVTIVEFYDANCPYCRQAAVDLAELLEGDKDLKLVLVPFPVLSANSIEAARIEVALAKAATPQQFHDFHRAMFAERGSMNGARALVIASRLGFEHRELTEAANRDDVTEALKRNYRLGSALGLAATPSFVIKDIAVVGYPGGKALREIVESIHRCDKPVC